MALIVSVSINAQKSGYKVGDMARDFNLKGVDGKMYASNTMDEVKGLVVIFTCNHCPYAVAYEDRIIELDRKYKKLGFPVIAINPNDSTIAPDDSYSGMIERAKEKRFTFPYLLDADQSIYKAYGATKTPHVYLLNKVKSGLKVEYIGAIDDNYADPSKVKKAFLADAIDALLKGKSPRPNYTKAIGCSIKSKK